ncbi:AAA family ATPase [Tardiphaga sp. vice304]|uniref:AAA family ATPase n=1 Tax=Tardiphaga sp. vice304 TaxID=2592817 RepID=UPI001161F0C9|nr:AAA family ATPase [Tardiphaga sp. vice304]QDM27080.1 AAA family ATPase [Tardiphaga sp. vice304]
MARLTSVTVRRFKSISTVEIPLDDVTLLIGANNSGKSTVLQAIHFAVSISQTAALIGENLAWQNDRFQLSFNPSQLLYSPVGDVLSLANGGTLQEPRESQIEIELRDTENQTCIVGLRRGRNRNIGVSIVGRAIGEQLMDLETPYTIYAPGLAGVPKEERYMSPGVVRRIVARGDANLTLRNVLRMLSDSEELFAAFVEDMQSIFPGIGCEVEFDPQTDEHINVFFRMMGGALLPIDAAGTSILQASQIIAYIHLFEPKVLILDEPDSHLHPDNQRLLCDLVFRLASERDFQAIISTHSRHVLNSVNGRGTIIWLNKGTRVDNTDINTTSVLLELGALDSVDYFADGETRCVVATEDTNTEAIKALLLSNGFVEDDIEIATYAGCTKADAALVLGGFLADKAPNIKLVVHRDRDYMSDANANSFSTRLNNVGIYPFITASNDIESYFVNAPHLHALNNAISANRIEELILIATNDTSAKSIENIVNQRTAEAFRERQNGGPNINHGAIAVTAAADFNANPALYRRGKVILGRLISLIQQEQGANPRVFDPTEHLQVAHLSQISADIW